MKLIALTRGYFTKVDDSDYEFLSKYKWQANPDGRGNFRAERTPTVNKKSVFWSMSRIITNCPKGLIVDHINGDVLDNQKSNLRICTISQNTKNQKTRSTNKTGYKGVKSVGNRFVAKIVSDNKEYYLGSFKTKEEAALVYNKKAIELFGEYARPNQLLGLS